MGNHEKLLEEQKGRMRELQSKIDVVKTRVGMAEDAEERAELRERIREMDNMMSVFAGKVQALEEGAGVGEEESQSLEKAYRNVKEAVRRASGGLVK